MQYHKMFMQYSAPACFAIWFFTPLFRRFMEWHSAFHNISFYSVIPLLALGPAMIYRRPPPGQLGPIFRNVVVCFLISYLYGILMSIFNGNILPAIYEFCMALSPLGLLVYIRWMDDDFIVAYDKFSQAIFWIACVASLYGIYQFVVAPDWDIHWLIGTGLKTFGLPQPFAIRIFGPTSSPLIFAELLAFTLVLNVSRYSLTKWPYVLGIVPMFAALILSSVRTAWVECAVGLIIGIALSPFRQKIITSLGVIILGFVLLGGYLAVNIEGFQKTILVVSDRLQSLGDLSDDVSYKARQDHLEDGLQESLSNPLGQGLGAVGLASKLSDQAVVVNFDNGYLQKLYETGLLGMILFMAGVLYVLWQSIALYLKPAGNLLQKQHVVIVLALQGMLLFGMSSIDVYYHSIGMFFWILVSLISVYNLRESPQPYPLAGVRLKQKVWSPLLHVR